VWTLLAGLEIMSIPLAPLPLMMHEGIAGVSGGLMGVFLTVLALTLWFAPGHRVFAGIATLVFAVASLILSNFGGFAAGFLLGILGGAMAVAWVPQAPPRRSRPTPHWPDRDPGGPEGGGTPTDAAPTRDDAAEGPGGEPHDDPADPGDGGHQGHGGHEGHEGHDGHGGPGGAGGGEGGDDDPHPAPTANAAPPPRPRLPAPATRSASPVPPATRPASPESPAAPTQRRPRGSRLRAIGALPAGGALLAGGMPAPAAAAPPATHTGSPTAATVQRAAVGSVCALLDGLYDAVGGPGKHRAPRRGLRVHADLLGVHATVDASAGTGTDAVVPGPRTSAGAPGRGTSAPRPASTPRPAATAGPSAPAHARRSGTPRGSLLGTVTGLLGLHPGHPHAADSGRPGPRHTPNRSGRPIAPVTPTGPTARGAGTGHPLSALATPARPVRVPHARRPGTHHHAARAGLGPLRPGPLTVPVPALPRDGRMDHLLRPLLPLRLTIGDPAAGGGARSPWCLPHVGLSLSLGAGGLPGRRPGPAATQPFRVRTPLLVLTGLTYHGIAAVPTAEGRRRVLVFTAWRVDIASLRQTAPLLAPSCRSAAQPAFRRPPFLGLPGLRLPLLDMGVPGIGRLDPFAGDPWPGCQGTLESDAAPGSTSTARGGPVLLLTRALSGDLLGLLPVTFTPAMPPPLPPGLTVPIPLFFTGVTTFDQYLGADHLSVPGLVQTPALPPAR
jgi:hypothetical protein